MSLESDLAEIRRLCMDGMKVDSNGFELSIIPITGKSAEDFPARFVDAVRQYRGLTEKASIFPKWVYLLPFFTTNVILPKNRKAVGSPRITAQANEIVEHDLVSIQAAGESLEFSVTLSTLSRTSVNQSLSPGEVRFQDFMTFAGKLVRYHKLTRRTRQAGWIEFLVSHIWTNERRDFERGFSTICDLWSVSLSAIDRFQCPEPTRAEDNTNRPNQRRARLNAQMLETLQENHESWGWSVQQWATHLGCSKGGIHKTKCWQETLRYNSLARRLERRK